MRVVDAAGHGVAGAEVLARRAGAPDFLAHWVSADAAGRAVRAGLGAGEVEAIARGGDGWFPNRRVVKLASEKAAEVAIPLFATGALKVRVLDANGAARAGVVPRLECQESKQSGSPDDWLGWGWIAAMPATDASGIAAIPLLPAVRFLVSAPGAAPVPAEVKPGETVEVVLLVD